MVQIRGHIEKDGMQLEWPVMHGHWDSELIADMADSSQRTLFKVNDPPAEPNRYEPFISRHI